MSAQNIISTDIVDRGIVRPRQKRIQQGKNANIAALGVIMLVLSIVIMTSVLIYMCISGSGGESMLVLGIFPFTIVFVLILLSR